MKRKIITIFITVVLLLGMVAVPAQAATEQDIEDSIEDGLAWLSSVQNPDGSWGISDKVAKTGLAVVKMEDRAFELGYDSPFDEDYEYSENVTNGLNYIFSQAGTYGAGSGVCFAPGFHETYSTGIAMMAIAASRDPTLMVNTGLCTGNTTLQVLQANVQFFAWSQNPVDGGWIYQSGLGWASDNSNTGYAVLGLAYAEDFGCTIPAAVKTGLTNWIQFIQCGTAGPHFGGSGYTTPCYWVNSLKTGNLLFEMAFVGLTTANLSVQNAIGYIENNWYSDNLVAGWGWNDPSGPAVAQYQATYCLMKGLEIMGIADGGLSGISNWYQDLADVIVPQQVGAGYWPSSPNYVTPSGANGTMSGTMLSTAWALLTLERVAPPPAEIEVPVDIKPTSCPNPLNTKSQGVLPVAILGTEGFDVTEVDPASVNLTGVFPIRWALEDVATPYEPYTGKEGCMDCNELGGDGYLDLTLKFDVQEVVAALGEVEDGDCVVLTLTGNLKDEFGGTAIVGEDVVKIIVKKGGKK